MEFCPRCGRYLKDDEYQCPECGNVVRQMPNRDDRIPPEFQEFESIDDNGIVRFSLKKLIFEKWFFVAFGIAFAAAFLLTYMWRFSIILFCVPLLIPMKVTALLIKYFLLDGIV